jgi:DNA-binding transcriptional LysR family regulator
VNKLTFDDLRLFQRLAALRNLSAVARELSVPTSQVSRSLVRIEKICGSRLAHRSTHGLTLTVAGESFLNYCHQISGIAEEMEGEFASQSGGVSGLVRVAASSVIAENLLLPTLNELGKIYPRLRVAVDVSDQMVDLARDGIDIAIRTSMSLPDNVIARHIGNLGRALYAAPSYVSRSGMPLHPDELANHQLVTNSAATHLNRWPFNINGKQVKYLADGHWQSNDTKMTENLVLQGLGIGRLATIAADQLVLDGRLVPVLADFVDDSPLPIYALIASARQRLPKIKVCIDFWSEQGTKILLADRTAIAL